VQNTNCAGQFYTCNANCPAPTAADRCDPQPGQWAGCHTNGCTLCTELVKKYRYYFARHPKCRSSAVCGGQYAACNANCPAPRPIDDVDPIWEGLL
jgi:hypothetical protein